MKNEKVEKIVNKDGKVKVYLEESDQWNPFVVEKNHKADRNEDGEFWTEGIEGEKGE